MSKFSNSGQPPILHASQGQLLAAANLGHFIWHPEPSRCEISDYCWVLIGLDPERNRGYQNWIGKVSCDAPGFRWEDFPHYVQRSVEKPAILELKAVAPDGSPLRLRLVAQFVSADVSGEPSYISGLISELDPLHRVADALAEGNQRFDAIAEGARVGLWHRNLQAGTGYWSKRFWELIGVKSLQPDPPMAFFYEHVHPDDLERLHQTRRAHLEDRVPYNVELRARGDDAKFRWFNLRGQATWDKNGVPLRLAGSLEDITARKTSEGQVESGRKFFQLMMNTMDDLMFVKDEQFRIQTANNAFLSLYPEETRDQVIGSTTVEQYEEAQREEFLAEDRRAFEEGFSETNEVIYFPNGDQRSLWTKKIRFEDQDGARFIFGYARDITSFKENERALLEANSALEEFAYRVSHDLRSPLESSVHLLEYLGEALERGDIDESKVLLATAQNSLGNLNSMAGDILNVHRIRHGELIAEAIDIQARVEHMLQRHRLDHDDLQLEATYSLETTPVVDPYGLELVLENLISNAVKYRDSGEAVSRVSVEVHSDLRYLEIAVADNGLGIPIHNRSKLFGMFQRFHPRESFGSGLGLYMTKQWAERMGGTIEAKHLDKGTIFNVKIPQGKVADSSGETSASGIDAADSKTADSETAESKTANNRAEKDA